MSSEPLCDLHSHLYGCLQAQDVQWLLQRYTKNIHHHDFQKIAGKSFSNSSLEEIANYYQISTPFGFAADFQKFQAHFDFLIQLLTLEDEEILAVIDRIVAHETAQTVEYRFMLPYPLHKNYDLQLIADHKFLHTLGVFNEGFELASRKYSKNIYGILSLSRHPIIASHYYELLKQKQKKSGLPSIVGVDFCGNEQHMPPKLLAPLLAKIHRDNKSDNRLAIVYHVGEHYGEKSLESAIRWVVECVENGCHRLGHAVALGISPKLYQNVSRQETIEERVDHLNFLIAHEQSLMSFGLSIDINLCYDERTQLIQQRESNHYTFCYNHDANKIEWLYGLQEWAMHKVKKSSAVIECMPTSNYLLTDILKWKNHPLQRFLQHGICCVIATDDRGIFATSLENEYRIAQEKMGISSKTLTHLKSAALQHTCRNLVSCTDHFTKMINKVDKITNIT